MTLLRISERDKIKYLRYLVNLKQSIPLQPKDVLDVRGKLPLAAKALETLLYNIEQSVERDIETILLVQSHGKTFTNQQGLLTGWSGSLLDDDGTNFAQSTDKNANIVICSDLPRCIHHPLLKYATKEVLDQIPKTDRPTTQEDYDLLVSLALDSNIVPTPLLRAQYYGSLELLPEKSKDWPSKLDLDNLDLQELYRHSKNRINPSYRVIDSNYVPYTESRFDMFDRCYYFFKVLENAYDCLKGRRIELVTHSGFLDIVFAYVENCKNPNSINIKKLPKEKTRYKTMKLVFEQIMDRC